MKLYLTGLAGLANCSNEEIVVNFSGSVLDRFQSGTVHFFLSYLLLKLSVQGVGKCEAGAVA